MDQFVKTLNPKEEFYFLTIKGQPGSHAGFQRVGYIGDQLRKISDTYFAVREENHAQDGWHYHCLLSLRKEIPKGWYKKHTHYNLQKIGAPDPTDSDEYDEGKPKHQRAVPDFTAQEIAEAAAFEPEAAEDMIIANHDAKAKRNNRKEHKKFVLNAHMERVVKYMQKEWTPEHKKYVDYIHT